MIDQSTMLNRAGAAQFLGLAIQTMDNWRTEGRGPRFVKLGARVLYERAELEAYRDANRRQSTARVNAA